MTDLVFKGFDGKTALSRYGFRVRLTSDEIRNLASYDWWEKMRGLGQTDEDDIYQVAEDLHFKWSREYGTDVQVKVYPAGKTTPIMEVP